MKKIFLSIIFQHQLLSKNQINPNDVSVVLIIDYKCGKSFYSSPCVNASGYSVNAGEQEFIFPPFSFFRIVKVEEREGNPKDPHIISMTTPKKKTLIEFEIKRNKTICYNREEDELYSK